MVKIGVSDDSKARITKLQNGCGAEILLVCVSQDVKRKKAYRLENRLHKTFAEHRKIGEWFDDGIFEQAKFLILGM